MTDTDSWARGVLADAEKRTGTRLASVEVSRGPEGTFDVWCVVAPKKVAA